jgi:hypothetical protein
MARELKPLLAVAKAVAERFHVGVNVSIRGGSNMTLRLPSAAAPADSLQRDRWAKAVAAYARARYPFPDSLNSVTVVVIDQTQQGAVTITSEVGRYEWFAEQLRDTALSTSRLP